MSQRKTEMPASVGHHLRQDSDSEDLERMRPRGAYRLHLARVDLFDRLVEQLSHKADRSERDRDHPREDSGPDDRDEQERPRERVDRSR